MMVGQKIKNVYFAGFSQATNVGIEPVNGDGQELTLNGEITALLAICATLIVQLMTLTGTWSQWSGT
jgi:hypothetical protein